jgi:chemosensory pili system protein ChpA (sensor histidine kinase/response regulator)
MAETFDIGPLSWVKDEIDQSLKKARDSFVAVSEKPNEFASLRFTTVHLYQVSGALDMVGLEGCKRYCFEIEKLTSKLEKQEVIVTQQVMAALILAVDNLSHYLQDLLNGMQDTPTSLYESLKPLIEIQGESLDVSDLFYPDITYSAPKDLPTNPIAETAIPIFVSEKRTVFQKALLDWLRTKGSESLNQMRHAIVSVQQVQQKSAMKTLWWASTAFIDALGQESIAAHSGAKKMCRRLDQQLKNMSLGEAKASSQLLRNVLYYVAVSESDTDNIASVKKLYDLDDLLATSDRLGSSTATASERAALAQLNADLPNLKDLWSTISTSSYIVDLESFSDKVDRLAMILLSLTNKKVHKLTNAIHSTVKALKADKSKINEVSFIEVAASLNLLEYIGANYQLLDAEANQKIATQTERLQSIIDGIALAPAVDAFATEQLDGNVITAVAKQIISALQKVEKALDTYFRNTSNASVLEEANKPLQQVTAAFDMLELPMPMSISQLSSVYVDHFKSNQDSPDSSKFELVAESLSILGLYSEELPNVRAESEIALANALKRLEQGAKAFGGVIANDYLTEEVEPALTQSKDSAIEEPKVDSKNIIEGKIVDVDQESVIDKAVDAELQDIFLTEAEEVLASLAQHLQTLRINPTDSESLVEVRRAYHTLKGSGRTVGLNGVGDVAWSVEKLLNLIMERKAFPTSKQLSFVENVTADFAGWVAELQANAVVALNPTHYKLLAEQLEYEFEHDLANSKPKPQKEEVVIGGTRTLSKTFFNIFLAEAQQHLEELVEAQKALVENGSELPTDSSCRAAHTLGSNALTAGFKPTGDLARALEHWLDEHNGLWTEKHIALFGNVVKALADGLQRAKEFKNPKSARALIIALGESTSAMQAMATQEAEAAVNELAEQEPETLTLEPSEAGKPDNKRKAKNAKIDSVILPQVLEVEEVTDVIDNEAAVAELLNEIYQPHNIDANAVTEGLISAVQPSDTAVDQELLGLFVEEARDLVPQIGRDLRGWRANPHEVEYPDSLQRALHTLKGSARMAGQSMIGDSVHKMEDRVIHALRHKASPNEFEEMFVEFDRIVYMLEDITGGVKVSTQVVDNAAKVIAPTRSVERKSQFLRMRADVLDRLINEAGEVSIMRSRMDREMQNFKQSSTDLTDSISRMRAYLRELEIEAETQMQSRMSLLQEANETFDPLEFDRFTRLQELTRMMAESVNDVATIQHGLLLNLDQTDAALQQQNRMNRELQQGLMGVRMLPFATISERLQRIVRQTARELNKRVEMTIEGENVELDRGVLDKMGAPLEHLLRNAVAHGLESTEERKKLGKPEAGQIRLKVSLENDEITIVVTDDGAGINLSKVKQKAIEKGFFTADQVLSDQALMSVIFEAGFSTADTVSQIAGRGVGLDVVRSDIAAMSGRIDVSNISGAGAMFNVYLPVTLSVAQVIMARVGNKLFAIPSVMVEQVQKLKQADLINAYEAHKVSWAGRDYPIHFLSKLIGDFDLVAQQQVYTPVVLLRSGTYRTALHIDEVIGNQEVVMKQIGTQLARVPGMIGATVLGDGIIVLVINPVQLANREALSVGAIKLTTFAPVAEQIKKVALVVDDSLTMRKVLSRVLEREEFEVITANDGIDAIQKLQQITPDIILTDIEMPRMDGFELSRHVRDNEKTSKIPLIIISSRTAEKHRSVAKELGVNAFLGKPVQDEELVLQVNALLK